MSFGRKVGFTALILALAAFFGTRCTEAQAVHAAIHGTVTDSSGAVVPGAKITATNGSTGLTYAASTDNNGYYVLPQVTIGGPYTISIQKTGFQTFKSVGLMLTNNQNYEQDAKLKTGTVSTTVQVSANAIQVDTSDTQMKQTFTSKTIEQMPLLGRDATILQKLTPGTVESSDRFGNYSSNGSQTQDNSYLVDGADINDAPLQQQGFLLNPDAIGEITLLTSTQNPQYSRNSGAIINETIKSGTNQFHGDGFEFYRDTFLNNGGYFAQPGQRPVFHQNLFGGTLGGPVLKNKLFFFLAYQGFRNAHGATTSTPVPTNDQLGRNASGMAILTDDSNNGTSTGGGGSAQTLAADAVPFLFTGPNGTCGPVSTGAKYQTWGPVLDASGNVKTPGCFNPGQAVEVPTSAFNPIVVNLLKAYVPSPNAAPSNYTFNSPNTEKSDQGIIRLDAQITKSDLIWGESIFQSEPDYAGLSFTGGDLPGFAMNDARHVKVFDSEWTHTFSPTTLNSLRAGYFRFNYAAVEPASVVQPKSLGFQITPQDAGAAGVPFMSVAGYFSLGFSPNGPQPRIDANEDFSDNFTKIIGNHNITVGLHVERFSVYNPFYGRNNGSFSFGGTGTYSTGDPLMDFLVGIPDSYGQGSGALINARAWETYAYAQDNWKVSDSFTFNYGIGYDVQTPFANLQYGGKGIICWVPGAQSKVFSNAPKSLLYPGDPGCTNEGGTTAKYDHFAPRMGFDWSPSSGLGWLGGPTGEHMFAIRGGFGLYFNRDSEESQLQNLEDPPFGLNSQGAGDVGGSPGFANPFQDAGAAAGLGHSEPNQFPYTFPTSAANAVFSAPYAYISTIAPNYDVPYTYNFNLNVQRQLPGNQLLQIAYVGSIGHKLVRAYEANKITAAGHADALARCLAENAANGTSSCPNTRELNVFNHPEDYTDPNGTVLSVGRVYTDGNSNYNSLQVQLQNRTTHGLYYNIGYTWSHALDNGSGFESSGFGNNYDPTGTNWVPGFQHLSYGNSEYDARNRFFAAYEYVVPLTTGMRQNYIVNEALGGWHVAGYTVLQSGNALTPGEPDDNRSLYCNSDAFFYYQCPDTPSTTNFHPGYLNPRKTGNYWFNTSSFSQEPLGTFGNVSRGMLHGPGFNYTDMDLFKDFPIGKADSPRYVEIRMEAFNAFNHPNFAFPDTSILDGSAFGEIFGVVSPTADGGNGDPQPGRAVQLAGKIYF